MHYTHEQLAEMSGYDASQKARIRRWASKVRHWKVLPPGKNGLVSVIVLNQTPARQEPNFERLTEKGSR